MGIIDKYKQQIKEITEIINRIQDECNHPSIVLTKTHGSNIGNYDPSADCYWTDFRCSLCEKEWTEEGSK